MGFEKSYAIHQGPDAPSMDEYTALATGEYLRVLEEARTESPMQVFLESNPAFVPGATTPGVKSGHDPMHCALITQPELTGLKSRRPDFLWVASHSAAWFPTFIEIESPQKRVFTQQGIPSADFSQARNQLDQWRVWLEDPVNQAKFIREYGIGETYTRFRVMRPHYVLVYGRRAEFDDDPGLSRQRGVLMGRDDMELVSYDRLRPSRSLRDAITVRAIGDGRYRVHRVMPTLTLGPNRADRLPHLEGLEDAIRAESRIPQERRAFLASRVDYWTGWARDGGRGTIQTSDVE